MSLSMALEETNRKQSNLQQPFCRATCPREILAERLIYTGREIDRQM